VAARRAPLLVGVGTAGSAATGFSRRPGRGDYIDGEVIDVVDNPADDVPPVRTDQPRLPE
jgi:UPF0716 protein FxsA